MYTSYVQSGYLKGLSKGYGGRRVSECTCTSLSPLVDATVFEGSACMSTPFLVESEYISAVQIQEQPFK